MAKITSVRVWGFESNYDTQYEVSTALTVFTGQSGNGKTSATMRALRWVANGEPSGEDFIYKVYAPDKITVLQEAKEAGVEITLDDGRTIRKTRSKGKTRYWLEPDYSEPFERAAVPEPIKAALGIRSTGFGDLEFDLNFAYQLDPPFLISMPESAGAKVLGKLAGTEAVDGAIKSVAKDTYNARQRLANGQRVQEQREKQLLEYQDLDRLEKELETAETLIQWAEDAHKNGQALTELLGAFRRAQERITVLQDELQRFMTLADASAALLKAEHWFRTLEELRELLDRLRKLQIRVETLEHETRAFAELDLAEFHVNKAGVYYERKAEFERLYGVFSWHMDQIEAAQRVIEASDGLSDASESIDRAEQAARERRELSELYKRGLDLRQTVKRLDGILEAEARAQEAEAPLRVAEEKLRELESFVQLFKRHDSRAHVLEGHTSGLAYADKMLLEAESELSAAWEALGGICPLCEQPLTAAHGH